MQKSFCKAKGNKTEFEYKTVDIKLWKGKWFIKIWTNFPNITFGDFASVNEEVAKCGLISVLELIAKNEDIDDKTEKMSDPIPRTFAESLKGFQTIKNSLYSREWSDIEQNV